MSQIHQTAASTYPLVEIKWNFDKNENEDNLKK